MGKLDILKEHVWSRCYAQGLVPYNELIALMDEIDKDDTVDLNITTRDFETIAQFLESRGFKMMAQNFGCDDDDFAEVLVEDRNFDGFDPNEYNWHIWQ